MGIRQNRGRFHGAGRVPGSHKPVSGSRNSAGIQASTRVMRMAGHPVRENIMNLSRHSPRPGRAANRTLQANKLNQSA